MKRFLSILLALAMVLLLVACGNKTTPDTPDTPDKQEETIHIGIVTGSISQSEDDRRGAEAFQQLYGEENVTLVTYPDNFTEELETTIQCMSSKITSTISVQLMPLYKSPHIMKGLSSAAVLTGCDPAHPRDIAEGRADGRSHRDPRARLRADAARRGGSEDRSGG